MPLRHGTFCPTESFPEFFPELPLLSELFFSEFSFLTKPPSEIDFFACFSVGSGVDVFLGGGGGGVSFEFFPEFFPEFFSSNSRVAGDISPLLPLFSEFPFSRIFLTSGDGLIKISSDFFDNFGNSGSDSLFFRFCPEFSLSELFFPEFLADSDWAFFLQMCIRDIC